MIRVIGVGDCFVDRYLFQNTMYPGGNSVNFAVYARMLGHESAFCGNLAQDVYAGMILDALDAWHIEHEHCRILPDGETGHGSIQLVNGDRVISDDNDNGSAKRDPLPITPELLHICAALTSFTAPATAFSSRSCRAFRAPVFRLPSTARKTGRMKAISTQLRLTAPSFCSPAQAAASAPDAAGMRPRLRHCHRHRRRAGRAGLGWAAAL